MKSLLVSALFTALGASQSCSLEDAQKTDCGFFGINQQQCEGKGCCWKPVSILADSPTTPTKPTMTISNMEQILGGTPWCYYPSGQNPCEKIDYNGSKGPGFDDTFYDKMYKLFDVNINIQGKGGVVAAPDHTTPGGSYYYHWMRDAALTMRTYMELNNFELSKIETKMKAYVGWVSRVQKLVDPNGFDIRINPKFELPNGEVYIGGWCRPQTDGPGLRSAALVIFSNILIDNGQSSYAKQSVIPLIKYDMDWIHSNWSSDGCDLWEEVHSNDFFWNRMGYYYTMDIGAKLFNKVGDSSYAARCDATKAAVRNTLDGHWTGTFMTESSNRQKDGATIHAFSSFNAYSITDQKVAKTIQTLAFTFCAEYPINQQDNKNGLPGILIGRYPGDVYAGGNPWQLLTAVTATTFYQGATALMQNNGFQSSQDKKAWMQLLNMESKGNQEIKLTDIVQAIVSAGDAVMYRLFQHVKDRDGHIDEQISKQTGAQVSAKDLTWSYANILSAMKERKKSLTLFNTKFGYQYLAQSHKAKLQMQ